MTKMAIVIACLLVSCPYGVPAEGPRELSPFQQCQKLPSDQRRQYVKGLTADQMDAFIQEMVASHCKDLKDDEIRKAWEGLAVLTGDDFERWGEKLLAEKRALDRRQVLGLLKDPKRGLAWRIAFHGYLRIILMQREPRDAYEVGLTEEDVAKLRDEIPKMEM